MHYCMLYDRISFTKIQIFNSYITLKASLLYIVIIFRLLPILLPFSNPSLYTTFMPLRNSPCSDTQQIVVKNKIKSNL